MVFTSEMEKLKSFATDEEIENVFSRLTTSFGGGEVLSSEQIEHFFKEGMASISLSGKDWLSLYIDTIRMLKLYKKDIASILTLNKYSIQILHDSLITEHQTDGSLNKKRAEEYASAVIAFKKLNGDYIGGKLKVELISTLDELNREGSIMNHCIASYFDIVINKQYIGFKVFNKETNERLTLGCYRKEDNLIFNQLKGYGNAPAKKGSCLSIIEFCKLNNIVIVETEIFDLLPAFLGE